jgi:Ca2+-transporting ATPase
MGPEMKERVLKVNVSFASKAYRVLALGMKDLTGDEDIEADDFESGLTLLGLVGIIDPVREDAKDAIKAAQSAGIKVVMITGDQKATAEAVARELGILKPKKRKGKVSDDDALMTGAEIDQMTDEEFWDIANDISVYARVSPEHKVMIVRALQAKGHVVAMTGDGVNDAPALKHADIGVAMGKGGTDVAREASDMVLTDDNFGSIVNAVEEGRRVYDNIRKFVRYLLTTNSGEIWVMFLAPLLGMPIPLIPLQILWINLVTDGLPALALGVEPPERNIMRRKPHDPKANIFSGGLGVHVIWVGLLMALLCLLGGGYSWLGSGGGSEHHEQYFRTFVFTIVTLTQMAHVLAIRSGNESLFRVGLFSNKPLLGAVSLTVLLQLAIIYTPWLQGFFQTVPLSATDLVIATALSTVVFAAVEVEKVLSRRKVRRSL